MNIKKDISILESLKKLKPVDLMYPGIFVLFFGVVIIIFFSTMQFISKNINKAFAPEESVPSQALDMEKYKLVTKKLGISVEQASNAVAPTETPVAQTVNTSTSTVALDKHSLTLMIKNSTAKKGVATTLAKALEGDGFAKAQTGNEPKLYATTTILLKESKSTYGAIILEAVHKLYPDAITTTAPEASVADATIIIGTH